MKLITVIGAICLMATTTAYGLGTITINLSPDGSKVFPEHSVQKVTAEKIMGASGGVVQVTHKKDSVQISADTDFLTSIIYRVGKSRSTCDVKINLQCKNDPMYPYLNCTYKSFSKSGQLCDLVNRIIATPTSPGVMSIIVRSPFSKKSQLKKDLIKTKCCL